MTARAVSRYCARRFGANVGWARRRSRVWSGASRASSERSIGSISAVPGSVGSGPLAELGVVGRVERHPPVREPHPEAAVAQDGRAGLVGGDGVDAGAAAGHAARLRRRGAQPGVGRVGVEAPRPVHQPRDGVAAQRQGEAAGAHHGDARAQAEVGAPPRHRPPCHRWGCLIRRHCVVASSDGRRVPAVPWRTGPDHRCGASRPVRWTGQDPARRVRTDGPTMPPGRRRDRHDRRRDVTSTSAARRPSTEGATDPVRLLRSWAPGEGSWFSGPRGAMLTRGVRARPSSADPDAVPGLPARGRTPGRDRPRSRSARCPTTPPRAPTSSSPSTSSAPARSAPC